MLHSQEAHSFSELTTDDKHCLHVHLTSDGKWEPTDDAFATNEESIRFELDQMSGERGQTIQSLSTLRQMLCPSPPWRSPDQTIRLSAEISKAESGNVL